ncbi:MAG: SMP-30/gluconolactonase/LRE family protein [Sedimentisphaerales bacterium]|nr:SMP-30/gluconolactonase/LRE family protein [Sedimentisphaerales bacterium]
MKNIITTLTILAFVLILSGCTPVCDCSKGLFAGVGPAALSTEFEFTEGPAVDKDGNVYFTDQPNDRIMRYTVKDKMEVFMQPSGRSNGLYFDKSGALIACADEKNELWRIDVKTKQHIVLAKDYDGKLFNGPNDAWIRPDGGIYFTDPFYKRPYWQRGPMEQPSQGVYFLATDGNLVRVEGDLQQANGIIGTPDGKTLYVADIKAGKTWKYNIQPDGSLTGKRLFCDLGSDGMTIDTCGNVYLTGNGVTVFNPEGRKIANIPILQQRWTANVTFGGKDRKTLFITAGTGLYALKMNVCGVQ